MGYCTSHSIRMDYVEKNVVENLQKIVKKCIEKDKMIDIAKQKLDETKSNDKSKIELDICQNKLSKIDLEIDSIYNDKLSGILAQDDFSRIYERKKQEKEQILNKVDILKTNIDNHIINDDEIIKKLIKNFNGNRIINRENLADFIDRIEVDKNKKIYVYFKFKELNEL